MLPIARRSEQEHSASLFDERAMFLEELGIEESGLDRLIQCSYSLLGLISFLTCGSDECRAWTITRGTKAPQAAGKIHWTSSAASSALGDRRVRRPESLRQHGRRQGERPVRPRARTMSTTTTLFRFNV